MKIRNETLITFGHPVLRQYPFDLGEDFFDVQYEYTVMDGELDLILKMSVYSLLTRRELEKGVFKAVCHIEQRNSIYRKAFEFNDSNELTVKILLSDLVPFNPLDILVVLVTDKPYKYNYSPMSNEIFSHSDGKELEIGTIVGFSNTLEVSLVKEASLNSIVKVLCVDDKEDNYIDYAYDKDYITVLLGPLIFQKFANLPKELSIQNVSMLNSALCFFFEGHNNDILMAIEGDGLVPSVLKEKINELNPNLFDIEEPVKLVSRLLSQELSKAYQDANILLQEES